MPRPAPSAALTKLEQLQEDKAAAVRAEDYIAAKSLKAEIDALKEHLAATTDAPGRDIGSRVAALEREKAIAVAREDYDAAKQIKGEIESLTAQMNNCKSSTMANAAEQISPQTAAQIQQVKAAIAAMASNSRPGQQELQMLQAQLQEMQQPQHQQPCQPHQPVAQHPWKQSPQQPTLWQQSPVDHGHHPWSLLTPPQPQHQHAQHQMQPQYPQQVQQPLQPLAGLGNGSTHNEPHDQS
jgi:hypothetical protein